jgi:hypothetical protein
MKPRVNVSFFFKFLLSEEEANQKSSFYLAWQKEQEALELFVRIEEQRIQEELHKKWIEEEFKAQQEWKKNQEKIASFKAEKAKQEVNYFSSSMVNSSIDHHLYYFLFGTILTSNV